MERNVTIKTLQEWWSRIRQKDRMIRLLLWVGVAGILLIGISEWLPHRKSAEETSSVWLTESQVEQALEQRIATLLREVEGVGPCRVMVTLETGAQAVYAADTVSSNGADGSVMLNESYLTVDTDAGPAGLLITRIQPTVKGVAVVCEGGGNETVRQRVVQVVSTAFHISERRVCVVQQD